MYKKILIYFFAFQFFCELGLAQRCTSLPKSMELEASLGLSITINKVLKCFQHYSIISFKDFK